MTRPSLLRAYVGMVRASKRCHPANRASYRERVAFLWDRMTDDERKATGRLF